MEAAPAAGGHLPQPKDRCQVVRCEFLGLLATEPPMRISTKALVQLPLEHRTASATVARQAAPERHFSIVDADDGVLLE